MTDAYPKWPKIPRLHKDVVITEKVDGSNALISVERVPFGTGVDNPPGVYTVADFESPLSLDGLPVWEYRIRAGSRTRWLAPGSDNFGFSAWVNTHAVELSKLGPGLHYGEWFGKGIQRGYGLTERRFALFNVGRWYDPREEFPDVETFPGRAPCPEAVTTVPIVWVGSARDLNRAVEVTSGLLRERGSLLVAGATPEGLCVYHVAAGQYFKVLLEGDERPKGAAA